MKRGMKLLGGGVRGTEGIESNEIEAPNALTWALAICNEALLMHDCNYKPI